MNTNDDDLLPAILHWLNAAHAPATPPAATPWSAADEERARQAVFAHGVGPFLHEYFTQWEGESETRKAQIQEPEDPTPTTTTMYPPAVQRAVPNAPGVHQTAAAVPASQSLLAGTTSAEKPITLSWPYAAPPAFRQYLAGEHTRNAARLRRVQSRLAEILDDAQRAGVAVLPLKGSLLIARGAAPWRVMADIDLLIHPQDRLKFRETMERRGYRYEPPENVLSHHETYHRPEERVTRWDGEDANNPLPVEIHHSLRRVLWGRFPSPDLTTAMWASAQPGGLFGATAWLPSAEMHYAYVALHALSHFLVSRGRLAHWLDLAYNAKSAGDLSQLPEIGRLYAILRLASHALPGWFDSENIQAASQRAHPAIRDWAERMALDSRCGLFDHSLSRQEKLAARWLPTPMRLALVYRNTPLPLALGRYLFEPGRHIIEKTAWNIRRKLGQV